MYLWKSKLRAYLALLGLPRKIRGNHLGNTIDPAHEEPECIDETRARSVEHRSAIHDGHSPGSIEHRRKKRPPRLTRQRCHLGMVRREVLSAQADDDALWSRLKNLFDRGETATRALSVERVPTTCRLNEVRDPRAADGEWVDSVKKQHLGFTRKRSDMIDGGPPRFAHFDHRALGGGGESDRTTHAQALVEHIGEGGGGNTHDLGACRQRRIPRENHIRRERSQGFIVAQSHDRHTRDAHGPIASRTAPDKQRLAAHPAQDLGGRRIKADDAHAVTIPTLELVIHSRKTRMDDQSQYESAPSARACHLLGVIAQSQAPGGSDPVWNYASSGTGFSATTLQDGVTWQSGGSGAALTLTVEGTPGLPNPADINHDGLVNGLDLAAVLAAWSA